jgi:hypothetical protein
MRGTVAKRLRKLARLEMAGDPDREIVASANSDKTARNSPNSVRGMYLALKMAYARASAAGRI